MAARPPVDPSAGDTPTVSQVYPLAETVAAGPSAPDDVPTPVGGERYEATGELGRGGMGRVLEARDRQFGRAVAIKELDPDTGDPARFRLEAFVTANLQHPGVPSVYEWGVRPGPRPFYAMQLVRGESLAAALAARAGLPERLELLPAVIQVAHTLAYAHERGVVHRDVKPANVMLGDHGEVALVDWGIAKVVGLDDAGLSDALEAPDGERTQAGSIVGTPSYMAPEQARGAIDEIDARTDVFGVGAILYRVLSGRRPYDGETFDTVVDQARAALVADIDTVAPDAPPALRLIVKRAMAPERSARYASAGELAAALEKALTGALTASGGAVEGVARAIGAASVLLTAALAVGVWALTPALSTLGYGVWAWLALGLAGVMLGGIEWRTRGRHGLAPLVVALACATLLAGIANGFAGHGEVMHFASAPEVTGDPSEWRRVVSLGTFIAMGNVTGAAALTALQAVLWAVGRRAAASEER